MWLFGKLTDEGSKEAPYPSNLSHISYNDETWHSDTLPKKNTQQTTCDIK